MEQVVCCRLTQMQSELYKLLVRSKGFEVEQDEKTSTTLSFITQLKKLCNRKWYRYTRNYFDKIWCKSKKHFNHLLITMNGNSLHFGLIRNSLKTMKFLVFKCLLQDFEVLVPDARICLCIPDCRICLNCRSWSDLWEMSAESPWIWRNAGSVSSKSHNEDCKARTLW